MNTATQINQSAVNSVGFFALALKHKLSVKIIDTINESDSKELAVSQISDVMKLDQETTFNHIEMLVKNNILTSSFNEFDFFYRVNDEFVNMVLDLFA